ncbi:type II and III secretion system protein family protein [Pseudoxanthomonas suwonensis]|nr:pilus assembly protein N-terminal domain-containing protein [Pseudoxanthomonas suwonensis]
MRNTMQRGGHGHRVAGALLLALLLAAPAWGAMAQEAPAATGSTAGAADPATPTPAQVEQALRRAAGQVQEVGGSGDGGNRALAGDGRASTAQPLADALTLHAGEAAVRRVPAALRRVAVGDGEILSVHTVGRNELVFIGTQPGETNVHLWLGNGTQRTVAVNVTGSRSDGVAATVRELLGNHPDVAVRAVGSNVVISGGELDAATSAKIAALQKLYPQVLNFAGSDPVGMRPMVRMDVTIMEFNKDAVEDLGIRWDSTISGPIGGLIRDVTTNDYFRVLPEDNRTFDEIREQLPTRLPGPQGYFGIATTIGSQINLLMSRGKAWVLAEPKLSARSGSNATFLVGGEVPIVIPSVLGQTQIEYKEYGIRLNISPNVNSAREVATSIMAEVSRIDPSVAVQGVPGFLTRRAETEINVLAGQTIVISGLLDREAAKSVDKFPILGDIPILGRLFRSDGFRGNRTELVIFVTPHIVTPDSPENLEELHRGDRIEQSLESEISPRQNSHLR